MPTYSYKATDVTGAIRAGKIKADSDDDARDDLKARGWVVSEIETVPFWKGEVHLKSAKVRDKDLAWSYRQLATSLEAGTSLYKALGMISRMQPKRASAMRASLEVLTTKIGEGLSLSSAMRTDEDTYGSLTCALIEAGEDSGTLADAFDESAKLLETQVRLQRQIKSAMLYPTIVLSIALGLFVVALLVAVPTFQKLFSEFDSQPPLITRIVLQMSDVMQTLMWWQPNFLPVGVPLLPLAAYGTYRAVRYSLTVSEFRPTIDAYKLRIPVIGKILTKGAVARIAATMSNLLVSGVSMQKCLELAARTANNHVYESAMVRVRNRVLDGEPLSIALSKEGSLFPELMISLINTGETTGQLGMLLSKFAIVAEEEVADAVGMLKTLVEPFSLIIVGGVVGVLVVALYSPLFTIINDIR